MFVQDALTIFQVASPYRPDFVGSQGDLQGEEFASVTSV